MEEPTRGEKYHPHLYLSGVDIVMKKGLVWWESLFGGLDHWTGLLDWNTGLTFDPKNRLHLAPYS